jgi:hypothetical protein
MNNLSPRKVIHNLAASVGSLVQLVSPNNPNGFFARPNSSSTANLTANHPVSSLSHPYTKDNTEKNDLINRENRSETMAGTPRHINSTVIVFADLFRSH